MEKVPNYRLQQQLGYGGFGGVWRGQNQDVRSDVAIKIVHTIPSDPYFPTRFATIGKAIAALRHTNIVSVREVNICSTERADKNITAYIVTDYVEGITLDTYMNETSRQGDFPAVAQIVYLFTSLGVALDYAHKNGIVHGNIRPGNILLDKRHREHFVAGEPLLTDLGLFQLLGDTVGVASPLYMSPEQASGQTPTNLSDIYALGVILYEMCTGVQPFRDNSSVAVMMQHINMLPTPPKLINPNIPNALSAVILRAMAKDPMARFPAASLLSSAVADACSVEFPTGIAPFAGITKPLPTTIVYDKPLMEKKPPTPSMKLPVSESPFSNTLPIPIAPVTMRPPKMPRRGQRFTDSPIYILIVALVLLLLIIGSAIAATSWLNREQQPVPGKQSLYLSSLCQVVIFSDT